ncbi:hypothetical protein NECAME_09905 [Necator americanus]|uniref:Uncharacterized protein n=1 Tax=Necator americanus TaxID=51031 RepID=W2TBW0_NECAM|nr:hypothetical protein NECAME_09905 [Necator americanus]ETN79303.1 hypothetical protein NECAME_09905 [Necator americanus]
MYLLDEERRYVYFEEFTSTRRMFSFAYSIAFAAKVFGGHQQRQLQLPIVVFGGHQQRQLQLPIVASFRIKKTCRVSNETQLRCYQPLYRCQEKMKI